MAADNKELGNFQLSGIAPARRGVPQIEVSFDIDSNGIVNVTAKDKASGKEQKIVIQNSNGLSEEEIDRMVKDAEANKAADEKRKAEVETRNKADGFIAQIDAMLEDDKDKIPEKEAGELKNLRDDLQKALDENDMTKVETLLSQLEKAAQAASQAMYQQQASASQNTQSSDGNTGSSDDDVVDAEFTEKK